MLQKLMIRNYALIDSVDVEFDHQLNVITGETGAGKSIILGALSLILGQRIEAKYFFNHQKKCVIEGLFVFKTDDFKSFFDENDIDFLHETTLRREVTIDGKSRAFINDTPVTLAVMKQVGERLIDIHSQHGTLEINDQNFQLAVVDSLAHHDEVLLAYKKEYKLYQQKITQLKNLQISAEQAKEKQDYEQFLFDELEQANLKADEQESLELEVKSLTNAEEIKRTLFNLFFLLSEQEQSVVSGLKESINQMQQISKLNPAYQDLIERLNSVFLETKDIASEINALEDTVIFNQEKIDIINERLNVIYNLQHKHKVNSISDLLVIKDRLSDSLLALQNIDEDIVVLNKEIERMKLHLEAQAAILSSNRLGAIVILTEQIVSVLKQIGMPNAQIKFEHTLSHQLTKDGKDGISLLFSANAGQAPAPVSKVASGGELSRLMLAIKSIMAKYTALPTLIFDEVDTGISGEVALRVGDVIGQLSKNMQVICITHLPQIAARGNAHYFVHKHETTERTTTGIKKLNTDERVSAIAEMLSGKNPSASALSNAKDLLNLN